MGRVLIAGNWKMNKTVAEAEAFACEFIPPAAGAAEEICICAPFIQLIPLVRAFSGTGIKVGAQNVHYEEQGAFTGEISCGMLLETGVEYVIVGHSERRTYFGDTDETVNKKLLAAAGAGLKPIVCVGENLGHRRSGQAETVVRSQTAAALRGFDAGRAADLAVAYEPLWAIGTGGTAEPQDAEAMCSVIRETVTERCGAQAAGEVRILYGGSVGPGNVGALLSRENIDGVLVGGASLRAGEFLKLINR
jgi:triosephosphate isomerase